MSCTANKEENIQKAAQRIRDTAAKGAQIICLQELFSSLYFCDVEDYDNFQLAEPIPGPTTALFENLAKELGVVIIASLFEKSAQGIYHNTTAVIDADGAYLGKYRKMHIPDDPAYYEKFYFTPGDLGYKVFKTKFANDRRADLLGSVVPRSSPYHFTNGRGSIVLSYGHRLGNLARMTPPTRNNTMPGRPSSAVMLLPTAVHVVSVNRVGFEQEGRMKFWGGSFVANPFGVVLKKASHENEEDIVVELELDQTDRYRTHWPFLRDRRIDSYQPITKRFLDEA